jgi:hypothetical protein
MSFESSRPIERSFLLPNATDINSCGSAEIPASNFGDDEAPLLKTMVFGEPASAIAMEGIDCTERCPATSAPAGATRAGERNFKTGPPIPSVISSL